MSAVSFLQFAHLAYLSNPASERLLYRAIRRIRATSIVELGVGKGDRATRLVRVALRYSPQKRIRYTGIDYFEARSSDRPGWTIKRAHRMLSALGAKVQLVPGDPFSALARNANGLAKTDIIVIGADQDRDALAKAWSYIPRMLHESSQVFLEEPEFDRKKPGFRILNPDDIDKLAGEVGQDFRRAA